jgi:hypothetical protein
MSSIAGDARLTRPRARRARQPSVGRALFCRLAAGAGSNDQHAADGRFGLAALLRALLVATLAGWPLAAQDHREGPAARDRTPAPSIDRKLRDPALVGAIDMHTHSDPDSYRRSLDAFEVAALAKSRGMRGIVLKNHYSQTAGLAYLVRKQVPGLLVFGGIALNTPVGGINPEAVLHMTEVRGGFGKVVWMPTHDSEQEVTTLKEERPLVRVSRDGQLLPEVTAVLALIAKHDLVLATGHVSADELFKILREAKRVGVKRIVVTHPRLGPQFTYLSVEQMQEAATQGAYLEFVSTFATGRNAEGRIKEYAEAIRRVGPAFCIVSSDLGQAGNVLHPDGLAMAARALRAHGFTQRELDRMFKENPARLLGVTE